MSGYRKLSMEPVAVRHAAGYVAMVDEAERAGEGYPYNNVDLAREDFATFVREADEEAKGIGLPPGIPPQRTYLLVGDGTDVLGEFRLRPELDEPYERYHGHIAYNLRPGARGHGYAKRGLALLLDEARACGCPGVMLTVEDENLASVAVIESNGGALVRETVDAETGERVSSYWIELS